MTYLTIALPAAAKAYIDRQISNGTYNTVDDFLTALIEREQERQAKQKVNDMLKSTIQTDRSIPQSGGYANEATDEWWEQQRQYLAEQLPPQS